MRNPKSFQMEKNTTPESMQYKNPENSEVRGDSDICRNCGKLCKTHSFYTKLNTLLPSYSATENMLSQGKELV